MKEPTKIEKIRSLQSANPKLTYSQACQLLGFKDDLPTGEDIPDFLKDVFPDFLKDIFNISDEDGKKP